MEKELKKPSTSFVQNEKSYTYLDVTIESRLDTAVSDVLNYISTNSGKDKPSDEQDQLQQICGILTGDLNNALASAKYTLYMSKSQFRMVDDFVRSNDCVFDEKSAIYFVAMSELYNQIKDTKFADDDTLHSFQVNVGVLNHFYHFVSQIKLKGLTKKVYLLETLIRNIWAIGELQTYYYEKTQRVSQMVMNWVASFQEGVEIV